MSESNFRDPLGLLWRMVRSGDAAARSALAHEAGRVVLSPLDVAAGWRERRGIARAAESADDPPLLLIVGAPRSGTSFVQQLCVRFLDVAYVPNGAGLLPRAPLLGARLFGGRGVDGPGQFESYFGQTHSRRGPSDAFFLWDRWLGGRRGHVQTLAPDEERDMRRTFAAWTRRAGKPLVNKNNRNTIVLPELARALPQARFLVVHRDPFDVVCSLVKAREAVQGDPRFGWGLLAEDARPEDGDEGVVRAVCRQVLAIEERIAQGLAALPEDRYRVVELAEVCEEPLALLRGIERWVPQVRVREDRLSELEPHGLRRHADLPPERAALVRELLRSVTAMPRRELERAPSLIREAPAVPAGSGPSTPPRA